MEFIHRNPDSTDGWYLQNMRTYICAHCTYVKRCKQDETMPVISALSRYILRWHAEMKVVPMYPLPGTWEDQPDWFSRLIATAGNTFNRLEQDDMKKVK